MITQKDYDWSQTDTKVVLLIPNYGRKKLLVPTIKAAKTALDKKDYHILIANDGLHEDMEDLKDYNVSYFTFDRKDKTVRNGCFIRNYCLKRLQSEYVIQKDPEVLVYGDFFKGMVETDKDIFTLGAVINTDAKQREKFLKEGVLPKPKKKRVLAKGVKGTPNAKITSANILNIRTPDTYYFFHYMYGCKTELLQSIRGYDEGYSMYGKEDKDMYFRLKDMKMKFMSDENCKAYHLWHKKMGLTPKSVKKMSKVYDTRKASVHVRNENGWGEG